MEDRIVVVRDNLNADQLAAFLAAEITKRGGDPKTAVLIDTDYPEEYGVTMNPDGTFPSLYRFAKHHD